MPLNGLVVLGISTGKPGKQKHKIFSIRVFDGFRQNFHKPNTGFKTEINKNRIKPPCSIR